MTKDYIAISDRIYITIPDRVYFRSKDMSQVKIFRIIKFIEPSAIECLDRNNLGRRLVDCNQVLVLNTNLLNVLEGMEI